MWLAVGVDLLLHVGQILAGSLKPVLGRCVFRLHQQDAGVLRAGFSSETHQQVLFAVAQLPIQQDHRFRAVIARIDRLGDQVGMLGHALVAAFLRETRGFITQQNHDLVLHVEVGVIVVLEFVGGDSVTRKHQRSIRRAYGGEVQRHIVFIELQRLAASVDCHVEPIIFLKASARRNRKRLKIGVRSGRPQAEFLVMIRQELRRFLESLGAIASAFHAGLRENLDVVEVSLIVDHRRNGGPRAAKNAQQTHGNERFCESLIRHVVST